MRHRVEVDQSIKIEDTGATVLAFSNDISDAIVLSSRTKREAFRALQTRGKSRDVDYLMIFAASLYLLLRNHLSALDTVVIDTEYSGHEATIRSLLLRHIWRAFPNFEAEKVQFAQVGKKSPAHLKAERVRRKLDRGFRTVKPDELIRLLKQQ